MHHAPSTSTSRTALALWLAIASGACGALATTPGDGGGTEPDAHTSPGTTTAPTSDDGGAVAHLAAHDAVANGRVPDAATVTPPILLHAYDALDRGEDCDHVLCSQGALAVAPSLMTGHTARWVRLGLASALDRGTFVRPPLDVAVAIDRSVTMEGDLAQVYDALEQLTARLRPDDRLAVVVYNDRPIVARALGPVGDRQALLAQVRSYDAEGGYDMHAGLAAALDLLQAGSDPAHRLRRAMVFSCAEPDTTAFDDAVHQGASARIGTSFFGVLLGYEGATASVFQETRGGAYYVLDGLESIQHAFDHEFDTMVTPIAYDLAFRLALAPGYTAAATYNATGSLGSTSLSATTAFTDVPRGSVMLRLDGADGAAGGAVGSVQLAYAAEIAVFNEPPRIESTPLAPPDGLADGASWFASDAVRRDVALVNEGEALHEALTQWHAGQHDQAAARVDSVEAYLASEVEATGDASLTTELAFVRDLRRAMGGS